jgi:hypothetical protein
VPQGLSKKIEFNLLLPDLALQLADLLLGDRKILRIGYWRWPERLHRPTRAANPIGSMPPVLLAPIRQMALRYFELLADRFGHFPGQHSLYCRKLELPGENTSFACGHPGSSLLFFIVSVSHFWGSLHTPLPHVA